MLPLAHSALNDSLGHSILTLDKAVKNQYNVSTNFKVYDFDNFGPECSSLFDDMFFFVGFVTLHIPETGAKFFKYADAVQLSISQTKYCLIFNLSQK